MVLLQELIFHGFMIFGKRFESLLVSFNGCVEFSIPGSMNTGIECGAGCRVESGRSRIVDLTGKEIVAMALTGWAEWRKALTNGNRGDIRVAMTSWCFRIGCFILPRA